MNNFQQMQANLLATREAFDAKGRAVNQHLNQSRSIMLDVQLEEGMSTDALFNTLLSANLNSASTLLQTTLNATTIPTSTEPTASLDQTHSVVINEHMD